MQILPFMLNGIDDMQTQLAILWVQLYILFHNKEKYERVTGSLLKEIYEKLLQFHQVFDATIALHMPSKGNTIKYHKKSHITDTFRRLGALKHCDSDQFEHDDHKRDKAGYRGTSRRVKGNAFLRELITRNRQVAIAKAGRHIKDVQKYKTAFMTAADTSSSQLYSNGMKVQLSQLAPGAHAGDSGTL
ncbi:hypothetical protein CEUSTIGMA_g1767.t1 [Chlamydomonas eustigma]|uniref:Uncharacterized protein n=1 Tax=Chlamydomonas eustigma TaxID=1157962 RepID=A0A250WU09_9CHLO|nr:hypothetical protein CEUSTIGMA_g1767.t1 [Chlamydomonas eustigma]|eukprot:GAX74318.1 hypothetical protein CEUSTIGMA_g1767.t1 [Chlamydomonas eustigma]